MLVITPILILILSPLIMLIVRIRKPDFSYFWLIAVSGALLTWPMILLARSQIPLVIALPIWGRLDLFNPIHALLLDGISWPFAMATVTLLLATFLTNLAHRVEPDQPHTAWFDLASAMLITAMTLLAIMSANMLTLILAWSAMDIAELIYKLSRPGIRVPGLLIMSAYLWRALGIILVICAAIIAYAYNLPLSLTSIPVSISSILLLAAGMRLGVLPVHGLNYQGLHLDRGTSVVLRITPLAASLVLISRTAAFGIHTTLTTILLIMVSLAAIYASLAWVSASDELDGLPYWILGLGSLALASALRARPVSSLVWGIALILSGGLLFLFSARRRWLVIFVLIGAFSISSLPFTPTWAGVRLYASPFQPVLALILCSQGLFLSGYIKHTLRPTSPLIGAERWVWVIYPWGLILLPLMHFVIAWWSFLSPPVVLWANTNWVEFWPSLVIIGLGALSFVWLQRGFSIPDRMLATFRTILTFGWLTIPLRGLSQVVQHVFVMINSIIEGQAGILWALLILFLLISLYSQAGLGG